MMLSRVLVVGSSRSSGHRSVEVLVVAAVNPPSAALQSGPREEQAERRPISIDGGRWRASERTTNATVGRSLYLYTVEYERDEERTGVRVKHRILCERCFGWAGWMREEEWGAAAQMGSWVFGERQTAGVQIK
jgi:hypothetical protein